MIADHILMFSSIASYIMAAFDAIHYIVLVGYVSTLLQTDVRSRMHLACGCAHDACLASVTWLE